LEKLALLACVVGVSAPLGALTVDLTSTNTPSLGSGVFATVTVTGNAGARSVMFSVDANTAILTPGSNFGIDKFAFNFDSSVVGTIRSSDFILPSGWQVRIDPDNNFSIYGQFDLSVSGPGNKRKDPLQFTIKRLRSGLTNDAIENAFYQENSDGYHFAAHIGGFRIDGVNATSAWFSDGGTPPPPPPPDNGTPVPEPATLALFGIGAASALASGLRKRKSV
jgi:hypothetical protein